jgi:hypothetical protein
MGLLTKDPDRRRPERAAEVAERLGRLAALNDWRFSPDLDRVESYDELPAGTFAMAVGRSMTIATRPGARP